MKDVTDFIEAHKDDPQHARAVIQMCSKVTPEIKAAGQMPTIFSAKDLQKENLPATEWAVVGLVPIGLSVLAGNPKVGKSFFSLDLALSVATGGKTSGYWNAQPGRALYLAMEDSKNRLDNRLKKLAARGEWPELLDFCLESMGSIEGTKNLIVNYTCRFPDTRLIILDTLGACRSDNSSASTDVFYRDYGELSSLQRLAHAAGISIVVVHHFHKGGKGDSLSDISGTFGIAGSADTPMLLSRESLTSEKGRLVISGRDVIGDYSLRFVDECRWICDGPKWKADKSDTDQTILNEFLADDVPTPRGAADIHAAMGKDISREGVRKALLRLTESGLLMSSVVKGKFVVTPRARGFEV